MAPTDRYIAETSFRVRYAETDAMGVVHHASYIVYFEEARSHYARERGSSYADFERGGFVLMVAEVHARYIKPAFYDQRLIIRAWLAEMKSRALTFQYEVIEAESGELLVTGETRHVCVTRDGKVASFPAQWRVWADNL